MAFNLSPQTLALLMGGANILAASRGGNRDLSKGGLGYALQQGLQGGLQGYQMGNQLQEQDKKQAMRDDMLKKLGMADTTNSPYVLNPETQKEMQNNPFKDLDPQKRELAKMAIMSGDIKAVNEVLGSKGGFGQFDNFKDFISAQQTTRDRASKALAPSNESLRKYGQATDLVSKKGGFGKLTGSDDTVLMKAFASMILPGEAVMSDDINIIAQQDGIPGWFKSYAAQLQGSGQLGEEQRRQIYQTMTSLAERANQENQYIRKQFSIDKEMAGFPEGSIFLPSSGFNPYVEEVQPQPVQPQPEQTQMIGDKKYMKVNGQWVEVDG